LGEVLFHYGPEQGRSIAASRAPFERVLYFDPGYVSALVHLARIAATEGRRAAVDSIVGVIDRLSPSSDRDLEMRVLRAYVARDVAAQQRVLTELGRASDATLTLPVWDVAVFAGDLDGAQAIARILTEPTRSRDAQALGHVIVANLVLAQGKLAAARAELTRAAAVDPVRALEYGTLLELTPFLESPRSVLETAHRALDRLAAAAVPSSAQPTVFFSAHDGIHPLLRAYLLGLVSARLGDFAAAERYAAMVARATGPPAAAGLPRDLGLEIRAEVAIEQGAPASALALLRHTVGESWYEYHFASPFLSSSRERYRRAGLEAALGDARQAIVLFSAFEGFAAWPLIYAGPSHLRRAALYERLGDRHAAASHYARFLTLWKECDPEFRPMLDSARAGYERATFSR
jgi:tetratricopeptide (TPR) repeat protein